ncbi:MAG: GNAT family N-acetyltransferase [Geminicoccaceae bacterium]|nr:GNAT family N-acetyltransferase [Geminicoccaceae bacterium]MDW8342401.1 GNAT family N-acetyltransferase [Geminicoccaceae bacterium]
MSQAFGPSVRLLRDLDALRRIGGAWSDLCLRALEPNPFYEPTFLLPLLECRGWPPGLRIAIVEEGRDLVAFVPLFLRSLGRVPRLLVARVLVAPDQPYGFLATPLLDRGRAAAALHGLFDALDRAELGSSLLELLGHGEDGSFARVLDEVLAGRGQPSLELSGWQRGLFRPRSCFESYLRACLDGARIRELRRQRRRLAEQGEVRLERLGPREPVEPWCERFLAMEAAGWKGRAGTAMACRSDDARFFRAMCAQRHAQGRLCFEALLLDGRVIASSVALLAASEPHAAFLFKIAHDESMRRFGPGILLEFARFEDYHRNSAPIRWADSCAGPHRQHLDRLWADRRRLGHRLIGARSLRGSALIVATRALRAIRARLASGERTSSASSGGSRASA